MLFGEAAASVVLRSDAGWFAREALYLHGCGTEGALEL
jgi:hypothetical protein